MTFLDAAERVLREESPGAPMHYVRLAELVVAKSLVATSGATPAATMNSQLTQDIRKRAEAGRPERFRAFGRGYYALAAPADPLGGALQRNNDDVRRRLRETLSELDPRAFEFLIARLLDALGFADVQVTRYSGDGGIDVEATLTVGGVTDVRTAVQVKRWANNVSGKVVRELRGGIGPHQRGLIITLSDFTPDGRAEAEAPNRAPVSLVNGERLLDLLIENEIGVASRQVTVLQLDAAGLAGPDEAAPEAPSDADLIEDAGIEVDAGDGERRQRTAALRSTYSGAKSIWAWPLPGGRGQFRQTLEAMLDYVASRAPTVDEAVAWLIAEYERVNSHATARGYWRVPQSFGLLSVDGEQFQLTADGTEYMSAPSPSMLVEVVAENVVGFDELMAYLADGPATAERLNERLCQEVGLAWQTPAQVTWRLWWLQAMELVELQSGLWRRVDVDA